MRLVPIFTKVPHNKVIFVLLHKALICRTADRFHCKLTPPAAGSDLLQPIHHTGTTAVSVLSDHSWQGGEISTFFSN